MCVLFLRDLCGSRRVVFPTAASVASGLPSGITRRSSPDLAVSGRHLCSSVPCRLGRGPTPVLGERRLSPFATSPVKVAARAPKVAVQSYGSIRARSARRRDGADTDVAVQHAPRLDPDGDGPGGTGPRGSPHRCGSRRRIGPHGRVSRALALDDDGRIGAPRAAPRRRHHMAPAQRPGPGARPPHRDRARRARRGRHHPRPRGQRPPRRRPPRGRQHRLSPRPAPAGRRGQVAGRRHPLGRLAPERLRHGPRRRLRRPGPPRPHAAPDHQRLGHLGGRAGGRAHRVHRRAGADALRLAPPHRAGARPRTGSRQHPRVPSVGPRRRPDRRAYPQDPGHDPRAPPGPGGRPGAPRADRPRAVGLRPALRQHVRLQSGHPRAVSPPTRAATRSSARSMPTRPPPR